MKFRESSHRSIAKAMVYRGLNILLDFAVVYLITRRVELTLGVTIATNFSSTVLYIFNERAWNRVRWGRYR